MKHIFYVYRPLIYLIICVILQACVEAEIDSDSTAEESAGSEMNNMPMAGVNPNIPADPTTTTPTMVDNELRPSLTRIGDKVAPVNKELQIRLTATDPQNYQLIFNVRSSLPAGAKFDKAEGLFTWTPSSDQLGQNVLMTFEASNGMLKDQETISIKVIAESDGQMHAPTFDMVGDQLLKIDELWSLQLSATDLNGDLLSYRLSGQVPQGLMLDHDSGRIMWTPSNADLGTYMLDAIASDGLLEGSIRLRLVVYDPNQEQTLNQPPQFVEQADLEVYVGEEINFRLEAIDNDSNMLNFSVNDLPNGAFFDPNTQRFVWRPGDEYADQAVRIVFEVNDGELRDYMRVTIQVKRMERDCPNDPDDPSLEYVSLNANQQLQQRVLCEEREFDLYQIQIVVNTRIDAFITFSHDEGDLDFYLLDSNMRIQRSSLGRGDEERIQSDVLEVGTYYLKVLLFSEGPSTYTIAFEEIGTQESCQDDALEGVNGNNDAASASALISDQTLDLSLCSGDLDFFSFQAQRGQSIRVEALFNDNIADIDLKLKGPNYMDHSNLEYWTSFTSTDNEEIVVMSAPSSGTYILESFVYNGEGGGPYQLKLTLGDVIECVADRLEGSDGNNTLDEAEPLELNLYSNLKACVDEDWYKTVIPENNQLVMYLTYDSGMPYFEAKDTQGNNIPYEMATIPRSDGCIAERTYCQRIKIPMLSSGELIYYNVFFDQINIDYDLRIRGGDEVAATCTQNEECNVGFECIMSFDYYLFSQGMCTESCNNDSDCGSGRACIKDSFTDNGICVQLCDERMQCRSPFVCDASITNSNQMSIAACVSDEFEID